MVNEQDSRFDWADIAKGIGIFLMVMGHAGLPGAVHNWIYSFHMPFFFILSGFFFKNGKYSFGEFVWRKFKTLIVPYIFFVTSIELLRYGLVAIGLEVPAPRPVGDVVFLGRDMGATWFLLSLFLTEVLYYLLDKSVKNIWIMLVAMAICFAASYYCYVEEIHLPYKLEILGATLLYYFLGNMASKTRIKTHIADRQKVGRGGGIPAYTTCSRFCYIKFAATRFKSQTKQIRCAYSYIAISCVW